MAFGPYSRVRIEPFIRALFVILEKQNISKNRFDEISLKSAHSITTIPIIIFDTKRKFPRILKITNDLELL